MVAVVCQISSDLPKRLVESMNVMRRVFSFDVYESIVAERKLPIYRNVPSFHLGDTVLEARLKSPAVTR